MPAYTRSSQNEPPKQLEQYACTATGFYVKHGIENRTKNEVIVARGDSIQVPSLKIFIKDKEDFKLRGVGNPTSQEYSEPAPGHSYFAVVGVAVHPNRLKVDIKGVISQKQQMVGTAEPREEQIDIIDSDDEDDDSPSLTLVVAPIKPNQGKLTLGALINPEGGLCTPQSINREEVFFFDELRDNKTDNPGRLKNWTVLAFAQCNRTIDGKAETEKQKRFQRGKQTIRLVLEPKLRVSEELKFLISAYKVSKEVAFLKQMKDALQSVEPDLAFKEKLNGSRLVKFADNDEALGEEEALVLASDLMTFWPDIENVTDDRLLMLKRGLVAGEVELQYKHLKAFIAEGSYRLAQMPSFDPDTFDYAAFATETNSTVSRIMGQQSIPSISIKSENREQEFFLLIKAIRDKLRGISADSEDFDRKMNEQFGDTTGLKGIENVTQIWEEYSECSDVDTSKAAFLAVARFLAVRLNAKELRTTHVITQLVETLDKMKLEG